MKPSRLLPSFALKLWQLMSRDRRQAAIVLVGLTLVGMALETVGIGVVVPAISVLTANDPARTEPRLAGWFARFGYRTSEQMVVACMLAMVAIYAIKALYLAYLAWRQ